MTRIELQRVLESYLRSEFTSNQIEMLYDEFDRNDDGKIDFQELKVLAAFLKSENRKNRSNRRKSSVSIYS